VGCQTDFAAGVPGSRACSRIATIPATGAFNPGVSPELMVNVVATPEPPTILMLSAAIALAGCAVLFGRNRAHASRQRPG